jgi:hypothetical protein
LGHSLLSEEAERIRCLLAEKDPSVQSDGSGFTAEDLGVGVYVPGIKENPSAPVETAIAFEKGYYS